MPGEAYVQLSRGLIRLQERAPSWGTHRPNAENTLTLAEIVYLRRRRDGERNVDIARALKLSPSVISSSLLAARRRFCVDTTEELLERPDVIALLDGGDGG